MTTTTPTTTTTIVLEFTDLGLYKTVDINLHADTVIDIKRKIENSLIEGVSPDMVGLFNYYDKDGNKLDYSKKLSENGVTSGSKVYVRLNADNYYIDDIGGMKLTNKKYIGNIKKFKNNYLTTQKRFEDSEILLKSNKLQLILLSMVGGISVLCLLLIIRKFSKKQ
tara:strand:- start:9901 stop:10398 length:498 start_codon:yes stop_codon:yes gene_type:complete